MYAVCWSFLILLCCLTLLDLDLVLGQGNNRRQKRLDHGRRDFEETGTKAVKRWATLSGQPTLIMAHRGERLFMPEHTLGAYTIGAIAGADYVEPDLVLTKDGILVCFHDLTLKNGTNVESLPQFAAKMANYTGVIEEGGENVTFVNDWFIKDFTLEELKVLRVVRRGHGIRSRYLTDLFTIPTFEEYLKLVHHLAVQLKRSIGVVPELKHSHWHNALFANLTGISHYVEDRALDTLSAWGYPLLDLTSGGNCSSPLDDGVSIRCGHLILQSSELSCIKYLAEKTVVDKMILIEPVAYQLTLLTHGGLKEMAQYATFYSSSKELLSTGVEARIASDGVVYEKELIERMGGFIPPQEIVELAHNLGLKVGIYTIYDSKDQDCDLGNGVDVNLDTGGVKCGLNSWEEELFSYFDLGVDAMFVENVGEVREHRLRYQYRVLDKEKE